MVQLHRKYTNTSTCPVVITLIIIIDNITVQNKINRNMRLSCTITIQSSTITIHSCTITIHTPQICYKDRLDMDNGHGSTEKCTKISKDTIQWNTALKVYTVLAGLSQDVILQYDIVTPDTRAVAVTAATHITLFGRLQ